ncbi:MAG TPA: ABC transporter permease [Actinomycetota bacterium]|nr:ABC transporter permease [Actinomycetota bacterium]
MSSRASSHRDRLGILLRMQLARVRTAWRPYVIVSSAMPLGIAVLLRAVMDPKQVDRFGEQIVAGSVVLAIAMTAVVMLAQRIASLKENGGLEFYSSLPVRRWMVIASVLVSFAIFSLPGTIIVTVLGALLFNLSFAALWAAVPVWALGSFALAGVGVAVGLAAPDEQLAGMYSNLAMMAVLFLGIIPAGKLPGWLGPVRAVLPSTYAVQALKPGLEGTISGGQVVDLAILAGFGALLFWAVRGPLWPRPE